VQLAKCDPVKPEFYLDFIVQSFSHNPDDKNNKTF